VEIDKERPRVLIEEWFPFEEVGIESKRERGMSSALPPVNYLHVWWARRPLIASKAAILTSIFPSSLSKDRLKKLMKFGESLIDDYKRIQEAKKNGIRLKKSYRNERAFKLNLSENEKNDLNKELQNFWGKKVKLLDPMSGGGSIPFEGWRLGLNFLSSELNPVAIVIQEATVKFPIILGKTFLPKLKVIFNEFQEIIQKRLKKYYFSKEGEETNEFLFARVVKCPDPDCNLKIPLSPNWKLVEKNKKITKFLKLNIPKNGTECKFTIISNPSKEIIDNNLGTIKRGVGTCPRCNNTLTSEYIKNEAQAGRLEHQIIALVISEFKGKKKQRSYRTPITEDLEAFQKVECDLEEKWDFWSKMGLIPNEDFPKGCDNRPIRYGMEKWYKFFNTRQLFAHLIIMEEILILKEKMDNDRSYSDNKKKAIITYLQIALDKLIDRNSIKTRWVPSYERIANTFDRHDFSFKWSYAESNIVNRGIKWVLKNVYKAYRELCELQPKQKRNPQILKSDAKNLNFLNNGEIDVIIVDPPYYNNVMYAELSDFFYVWMKRGLGDLYPDVFNSELTDKDNEAVANVSRFEGMGDSKTKLAKQDYESKMELCFREMHRVLQLNGVLTIMFTHKSTDAWDTLAMSLMDAGFEITASWPVHTESQISLHIAKKNAVKTTIFLVCRKRSKLQEQLWWEDDILPSIREIVSKKAREFRKLGIEGIDLFISCFGPALKEFSKSYPVKNIAGETVRAEEAIEAARRVVIDITLHDIIKGKSYNIDAVSKFYLTAWHFFKARSFPFDEARRLALSIGINIDDLKSNYKLISKKSGDVELILPRNREKKGTINVDNPKDNGILINAVHIALLAYEEGGQKLFEIVIEKLRRNTDKSFRLYMETLFNVLPDVKDLAKNLPEKKILGEILMTTEEKITPKGGKITDFLDK